MRLRHHAGTLKQYTFMYLKHTWEALRCFLGTGGGGNSSDTLLESWGSKISLWDVTGECVWNNQSDVLIILHIKYLILYLRCWCWWRISGAKGWSRFSIATLPYRIRTGRCRRGCVTDTSHINLTWMLSQSAKMFTIPLSSHPLIIAVLRSCSKQ